MCVIINIEANKFLEIYCPRCEGYSVKTIDKETLLRKCFDCGLMHFPRDLRKHKREMREKSSNLD